MSQASRSHALRFERGLRKVARELVLLRHRALGCRIAGLESLREGHAVRLMNGETGVVDVHAAREHARSLIRGYADNDHARNLCKLGLLIRDALERQASECQNPPCVRGRFPVETQANADGWADALGSPREKVLEDGPACPDCHGTGHNLRGTLPALEWSPQIRRRVADAHLASSPGDSRESWPFHMGFDRPVNDWLARGLPTRVCPRGTHRPRSTAPWPRGQWKGWSLDQKISARGAYDTTPSDRRPRWQLGEQAQAKRAECSACEGTGEHEDEGDFDLDCHDCRGRGTL